jgi:glucose/arabinose dehydrogenase
MKHFWMGLIAFATLQTAMAQGGTTSGVHMEWEILGTGYNRPAEIINRGDNKLYIVEQPGRIRILLTDGTQLPTPFLTITDRVDSNGNEKGLLGLAFPPDYNETGYFFVNYTHTTGGTTFTRVSRFSVSATNPDLADANSEEVVLQFVQDFSNHNGGQLEFGPNDGYLYIASGDGGSGGDPLNRAQNLQSYLGKMLRIDVSTIPYTIPPDNPFADDDSALDEIWSYGLRNPWKFAFDGETGDMYMGDVGQSNREEVNWEPAGVAGSNYGWRCFEGTATFNSSGCGPASSYVPPVFEYNYGSSINGFRCSVTGGRVYRGSLYGNIYGKYLVSDYCSNDLWVIWYENEQWNVINKGGFLTAIVAFAQDTEGQLYAVRKSNNTVYRLIESCSLLETTITLNDAGELVADIVPNAQNYSWFLNGNLLSTTLGNSILPQSNGDYTVQIATTTGCTVGSPTFTFNNLSTGDHDMVSAFAFYPNPAGNSAFVRADLLTAGGTLTIEFFTSHGKSVHAERIEPGTSHPLDLGIMPAGFYTAVLSRNGERLGSRKFIKSR